ncbi:hypothetical protein OL548_29285 [Lysinibacillus sp. MHQ-1]|nr:hypothetical protein OL548_29285 [Lysinibacillus sp. MHQ-1]
MKKILGTRYTAREPFKANVKVNKKLMAQFTQLAMIGGEKRKSYIPFWGGGTVLC